MKTANFEIEDLALTGYKYTIRIMSGRNADWYRNKLRKYIAQKKEKDKRKKD